MLPSDLLFSHKRGAQVYPRFLRREQHVWAEQVLDPDPRASAPHARRIAGGVTGVGRRFARLSHRARFRSSGSERRRIHSGDRRTGAGSPAAGGVHLAAERGGYGETQAREVLEAVAPRYQLDAETLREALYADLPENHLLTALPDFTPDTLVDRYNLAQAQGLLYSALCLRLTAHRNVPGEYRRLFQHLKFHGLMYAVEGNLDDGYQIYVDGPASLFKQTRKYGLQMAMFLPALLRVSRWEMEAVLQRDGQELSYPTRLAIPAQAADRRAAGLRQPAGRKLRPPLGETGDAVGIGAGSGDRRSERHGVRARFALRHPDGRIAHVEIMGFWHPDYLRRKLDKLRRAAMPDLIVAVSERLNVGADDFRRCPVR
jgi:predicted nuclease of restriction endonuclease-like RecB superfamily